ncbi:unnamed protein product [Closterium sp. Naga37s-1]|nr:unnamed protein product [Closterium sp. Naga37s-1]
MAALSASSALTAARLASLPSAHSSFSPLRSSGTTPRFTFRVRADAAGGDAESAVENAPAPPKKKTIRRVKKPEGGSAADDLLAPGRSVEERGVTVEGVAKVDRGESSSTLARALLTAGGDAAVLILFAYIGRATHVSAAIDWELIKTAQPFLAGWCISAIIFGDYSVGRPLPATPGDAAKEAGKTWALGVPVSGVEVLRGVLGASKGRRCQGGRKTWALGVLVSAVGVLGGVAGALHVMTLPRLEAAAKVAGKIWALGVLVTRHRVPQSHQGPAPPAAVPSSHHCHDLTSHSRLEGCPHSGSALQSPFSPPPLPLLPHSSPPPSTQLQLGIAFRSLIKGQPPQLPFLAVAIVMTSLLMLGWRAALAAALPGDGGEKSKLDRKGSVFELLEVSSGL